MLENDRLVGWREIEKFTGFDKRQLQRFRREKGLPIEKRGRYVSASKQALIQHFTPSVGRAELVGNTLTAYDTLGRRLWSHQFRGQLRQALQEEAAWRVQVADIQDDGINGVLVACAFAEPSPRDVLSYFSAAGDQKWECSISPNLLDSQGNPFEDAWSVRHVVVARDHCGPSVWVAVANCERFAGCVLRVDATGHASVFFANAGNVERVCYVPCGSGDLVVMAGENNAFGRACAAAFPAHGPSCASPPGDLAWYTYANGPAGLPLRYILFPNTELITARDKPYGHVVGMRSYRNLVAIDVETGGEGAAFIYQFTPELRPMVVWTSGSHDQWHERFSHEGRLDHQFEDCPELSTPPVLKTWERDSGWRDEEVPWRLSQRPR